MVGIKQCGCVGNRVVKVCGNRLAPSAIAVSPACAERRFSARRCPHKVACMKYPFRLLALLAPASSAGQADYEVVSVQDGGTIKGTVKWQGALPHLVASEINKDQQVCNPTGEKRRDLERLLVGPNRGVANRVVFLRNISRGKQMDLPVARRSLNQKNCRYEPHILLVPVQETLTVKSSDPLLQHRAYVGQRGLQPPVHFRWAGDHASHDPRRHGQPALQRRPCLDEW